MMGLPLSDGVEEGNWDIVGVGKGNSDRGATRMLPQATYKIQRLIVFATYNYSPASLFVMMAKFAPFYLETFHSDRMSSRSILFKEGLSRFFLAHS